MSIPINIDLEEDTSQPRQKGGRKGSFCSKFFITPNNAVLSKSRRYSKECTFCHVIFQDARAETLEKHINFQCKEVSHQVRAEIAQHKADEEASTARKRSASTLITKHGFTNSQITETRKSDIDQALLRAIVLQGLPFALVEGASFKQFLQKLQPNYKVPGLITCYESRLHCSMHSDCHA